MTEYNRNDQNVNVRFNLGREPIIYNWVKEKFTIIAFSLFIFAFIFGFLLQNPGLIIPVNRTAFPDQVYNFIRNTSPWLEHSYLSDGIVRRVFLGTFFSPIPEPFRQALFIGICIAGYLAAFGVAVRLANLSDNSNFLLKLWVLIYAVSSAGAMNLGWLLGYFETINYGVMVLAIFLIFRNRLFLASLALSVGILIHESFLFVGLPMCAAVLIAKSNNVKLGNLLSLMFVPLGLSVYLLFFGASNIQAMGANRTNLVQPMRFSLIDYSVILLFLGSLFFLHARAFKKMGLRWDALFFAPYIGCTLFLMGVDYMRWISIIFVSVIASIFTASIVHRKQIVWQENSISKAELFALAICAFPFLGPLGNTHAFLAFQQILTLIGIG